jgi:hypothetical protein
MRSLRLWLVLWLAVAACGELGGQTGSLGPEKDECRGASDCDALVVDQLASFTSPAGSSLSFSSAECTTVSIVGGASGPTCNCQIAEGQGVIPIGPVGVACYRYGRAGDCLWSGDEFEGCDLNDPSSCDVVCSELEQRLADDAARTFEASAVYSDCQQHECQIVLEIEGRCYADGSYQKGRSYDCSLGAEAILAAEKSTNLPPQQDERPETRSPYVPGSDGMVQLVVSTRFAGAHAYPASFGALAQFAVIGGGTTAYGESIDPLEGLDDCGIFVGSGSGAAGTVDFFDAADVRLLDGATARTFELAEASNADFYSYLLELEDVEPRFGQRYGVHVSGGTFGSAFDSTDGLHLPQALEVSTLLASSHFEQADLQLSWSGTSEQPLYLQLLVNSTLGGFFSNYELACMVKDDGNFVIPGELLQALPVGFATVTVAREDRRIVESGSHSLLLLGSVEATHQIALGPMCETDRAILDACTAMAESVIAEYEACAIPPPELPELCPDFLATTCDLCTEYFACVAGQTRCTKQGLTSGVGCGCTGQ